MPKRKVRLTVRLPPYPEPKTTKGSVKPGMAWRTDVYRAIMKAAQERGIEKYEGVDLECEVVVFLSGTKMKFHDVDNLQKHIFDALQGRLGGPKARKRRPAILPNDYQIHRVVVEKREHRSSKEHSRLIIRDYAKIQGWRKRHPA
jgi:Holliday junction resolvase RusA-like endonuclease